MTAWTTLNAIRAHGPCTDGWKKLLNHLGKTTPDDEPVPFSTILDSNGLDDALWCLRTVPADACWRLYAVWCASRVEHLMTDERNRNALTVAHRYALECATDQELNASRAATRYAEWAHVRSYTAWCVTFSDACSAARAAAWSAAREADLFSSSRNASRRVAIIAAESIMLCRVFECPTMGKACAMLDAEIRATREKLMEAA